MRASLTKLHRAAHHAGVRCLVFVADLGSDAPFEEPGVLATDDVLRVFPVRMTHNDYWATGMRKLDLHSSQTKFDFTLWLNNDVELQEDAVVKLLTTSARYSDAVVVAGSTQSPTNGSVNYGGYRRGPFWARFRFTRVFSESNACEADLANGNILFYSELARRHLGPFPGGFSHTGADYWFTYRARQNGVKVIVAPGLLGTCPDNVRKVQWRDNSLPRHRRFELFTAKNVQPIGDWFLLAFKLGGISAPAYFISPFCRIALKL